MLVNNIISLGVCIVPSNNFPLLSVTEEKRGKNRGGERVLVSMVLSTMDYDQLGTKPGHEAMDTKSGHEVWTRSHSESALFGDTLREAGRAHL